MELTERKQSILKSIVDEYIRSGEPVGSKYIAAQLSCTLSSATIRNEMSELELMGYLGQPHSSAGRVPTTKGYRTYIEGLMEQYKLSLEELNVLNSLLDYKVSEFGKLLNEAARVMSQITNYTAISVLKPPAETISHFRTAPIDRESFFLIMDCRRGETRTATVNAENAGEVQLRALADALNASLAGLEAEQITLKAILKLEEAAGEGKGLIAPSLRVIYDTLGKAGEDSVQVEGLTKLLSYPEFYDVGKAKEVLEVLEQKHALISPLTGGMPGRANVVMSGEGLTPRDASVVFYPITSRGRTVGAIGVIGPKRMNYKKVIANLGYFASGISEELNDKNDRGKDDGG